MIENTRFKSSFIAKQKRQRARRDRLRQRGCGGSEISSAKSVVANSHFSDD
jgi:hypothetical protein